MERLALFRDCSCDHDSTHANFCDTQYATEGKPCWVCPPCFALLRGNSGALSSPQYFPSMRTWRVIWLSGHCLLSAAFAYFGRFFGDFGFAVFVHVEFFAAYLFGDVLRLFHAALAYFHFFAHHGLLLNGRPLFA
jgi:hypothetical protein